MSVASAGVGDVYYCQTSKVVEIEEDDVREIIPYQFTFKRYEEELVFGKDGYFDGATKLLTESVDETFGGGGGGPNWISFGYSRYLDYRDGKFRWAEHHFLDDITIVVMASCDVFE